MHFMTIEAMHFSISGDFITNHCRDLWIEENCEQAVEVLLTLQGFTRELAYQVILGRQKLVGINELFLEEDDVTEHFGMTLLTPEQIIAKKMEELEKERQRHTDSIAMINILNGNDKTYSICGSPWGKMKVPSYLVTYDKHSGLPVCTIDWDEFEERFPELIHRIREDSALQMHIAAEWIEQQDAINADNMRSVDSAIADEMEARTQRMNALFESNSSPSIVELADAQVPGLGAMFQQVEPERGTYKDKTGWLLPDGKFYKCKYFQHDNLAAALGHDVKDIEGKWIRVQHPQDGPGVDTIMIFRMLDHTRITKRQINFMWDYCEYHKVSYPQEQIDNING